MAVQSTGGREGGYAWHRGVVTAHLVPPRPRMKGLGSERTEVRAAVEVKPIFCVDFDTETLIQTDR